MVGSFIDRSVAEAIFRDYIAEMSDERLEKAAADRIWLCETMLHGPWDEDVWKRDFIRVECERREKPEIFQRAEDHGTAYR
jgi:hypothetical protein